jgi:hypothetical protein
VLGNLCCGCNILMHNKFSCEHTVLENNLRENSSLSYLFTKPTKQVFKFVRTKTEACALKLETIRGPSALSVYMSNLWLGVMVLAKTSSQCDHLKCFRDWRCCWSGCQRRLCLCWQACFKTGVKQR